MEIKFRVAEQFTSINGEGTRAGELAVFVRLCGCNLHCSYCDTQWANQGDVSYTLQTAEEIVQAILQTGIRNVTLTGWRASADATCGNADGCHNCGIESVTGN